MKLNAMRLEATESCTKEDAGMGSKSMQDLYSMEDLSCPQTAISVLGSVVSDIAIPTSMRTFENDYHSPDVSEPISQGWSYMTLQPLLS